MRTREIDRLAWGTDAGFYRLLPQEVLMPPDEAAVLKILARARNEGKSITFRAAGTSLSGQAITDSLLVVCGKKWERYEVLDDGRRIRLQPGIVGDRVNAILRPYGRRFTPDPASVKSAMVGGIVMNNASGMSCGTHSNSYRMIESVRLVLADGTVLDTGDKGSRDAFAASHAAFLARIRELRERTLADTELAGRIRHKYSIKNVTGLTILPFVEYEDPFDIIAHLIPGSEGTLAFLSEVVFRTGEIAPLTESALLLFPTARAACEAVAALRKTGAAVAAEFFDRRAMRVVEKDFPELAGLPDETGALLVKIEAMDADALAERRSRLESELSRFPLMRPASFTSDATTVARWWAMRSGIFPAVGATREIGTTCLIEDIAVPIDSLADATDDLQRLFRDHDYPDAVIYGHALDGNWHFILNQRFDSEDAVSQYDSMMREVVALVTEKYGGSLKAEHGTGRNMAPFVRREWGDAAYQLMKDVKALFDPDGILNPGVIFNEDPGSYVRNLKPLPRLDPLVDRCIECGFCEVNCVAHGYALSSRQRIVVQREIARLGEAGRTDPAARRAAARLVREFRVVGRDLCAGDGLCSTSCPVGINTGELIHAVRERELSLLSRKAGAFSANHFPLVASAAAAALSMASFGRCILGRRIMAAICTALHKGTFGMIPLWTPSTPGGINARKAVAKGLAAAGEYAKTSGKVVYFPSCINQRMGAPEGCRPLVEETIELLGKAGYEVVFPKGMKNLCCGTIWESKGMPDIADRKTAELEAALREASEDGRWPVLCDQSPCLHRMREKIKGLEMYEPAEFIEKFVLDKVEITPVDECVSVHVTCSTRRMGLADAIVRVARACAKNVLVPDEIGCCAFAGDKGFTHPGLNEWALRKLRAQVERAGVSRGYSNSRTCEIGLSTHSGVPYANIVQLVNRVARSRVAGCVAAILTVCGAFGGELVVEPGGLTPHQALAKVRAAKAAGDKSAWTIRVKAGTYTLKESLAFGPDDSGTREAPVKWIGDEGKAVFAGGEKLAGWKDEGGGVWSAPLPVSPDGRPAYFEQLWVDGRRADRARLPDRGKGDMEAGYFKIASPSITPATNSAGNVTYVERVTPTNAAALAAVPADELAYAQMCVVHKWSFARRVLKSIDPATLTVTTYSPNGWGGWQRWNTRETLVCFENVRPGFDSPGEWFYDAKACRVLYRPLPGEDMAKAEVYVPSSKTSRLVDFRGRPDDGKYVHDIVFKGITFAYSDSTHDAGSNGPTQSYQHQAASWYDGSVTAEGIRRISFDRCTFAHTGNYGIRFNDGCVSNKVTDCTFFDLGAGGIWMGAEKGHVARGERLYRRVITKLAPRSTAFNLVENCELRDGGNFNPEGTGIALTHVSDSKVLNCEIHDFYYTGVSVGWTWGFSGSVAQRNEIAYNRIYDLGKGLMSDMGGVYTLGTSYGTRVHHNVIHDIWAYAYGGWTLYTDEGSEGITMDFNLCWNTTDGGFHQHYGSGCIIRNNIFAWNRRLGAVRTSRQVVQDIQCTLNFVNNIVVVREGPLVGRGPRGVRGVWAGNVWYDFSGGKPELDGLDWEKWRACGKDTGSVYADPLFVNADAYDFRLKPDSPAFALGFKAWDYSVSGLKKRR